MFKKFLIFSLSIGGCISGWAWSQKGHDVTAYIAEKHLTPTTQHAVDSILDGKSIVYWANWLDNASHTPDYKYTSTWHYKNINKEVKYEEAVVHPLGNIDTGIASQIEKLSNGNLTKEQSALALKILVHLIGDLHQPMHIGRQTDLGGNKVKVKYFNQEKNLHSVWDGSIVESGHKWSYSEWQDQIDRLSTEEESAIVKGTVQDWGKETYEIVTQIYEETPEGSKLSYDYVAKWTPVIEIQFEKGGLRLAHVLNAIFDPEYGEAITE